MLLMPCPVPAAGEDLLRLAHPWAHPLCLRDHHHEGALCIHCLHSMGLMLLMSSIWPALQLAADLLLLRQVMAWPWRPGGMACSAS